MKIFQLTILILLSLLISQNTFAQNNWVTDSEMQFKILAPANYAQNQFRDGTDKILALVSPDENVAVRVRAMHATNDFTIDLLQQVFEQNIISGAKLIMKEDGDLHGIPARATAYTWKYNNIETVIGTYYIIQNGFAYVIWTIVPQNLLQQRSGEADKIIDSFTLIKPTHNSGLLSGIGTTGKTATNTAPAIPSGYKEMVSDDACLEHLFPKNYRATDKKTGQTIYEDGSGIKMIVQVIFKQGTFRNYMGDMVSNISRQGADLVKNKYTTINGLDVLEYHYQYGDTYFAYFGVENNNKFYMVGFVGDTLKQSKIKKRASTVVYSIKKASCPN
jgi:hypothetical protein